MNEEIPKALNVLDGAHDGYFKRVSLTEHPQIQIGDVLVYQQRSDGRYPCKDLIDRFRPVHAISEERTFELIEDVFQKFDAKLKRRPNDAQLAPGDLLFFQQGKTGYPETSAIRAIFRAPEAT